MSRLQVIFVTPIVWLLKAALLVVFVACTLYAVVDGEIRGKR